MPPPAPLLRALHAWTRVLMHRSMNEFMRYARDAGMSMQQFGMLFYLSHHGACAVSDIGGHLGVTSAAASQMVERLVQQGLLQRSEDPHDRRVKKVVLTPQGQALVEAGVRARQEWMEALAHALTPTQQKRIVAALTLLTEAAQSLQPDVTARDGHVVP